MTPTRPLASRPFCRTPPTTQILEAWEASQQQEQERKQGDSAARTTLISSRLQECPATAPSSGTAGGLEGLQSQGNGARAKDAVEAPPTLMLPKPNPFIPSEFAIKEASAAAPSSSAGLDKEEGGQIWNKPCPRKVVRENAAGGGAEAAAGVVMLTLWHLQDRTFMQPRAEIYLKVIRVLRDFLWCVRGRNDVVRWDVM